MSRPLPPEVYRRRRVVAAAGALGVLLVVWFVLRAFLNLGGGDEATPTTSPSTPPTAEVTEEPAPDGPAADGTVPVSLTSGTASCAPESVRISPSVPADQSAGGPVTVALTVSSTSAEPCVLDADDAQLVVVIDDGDNPIYDSTSCTTSILASPVSLSPEWATVTSVTWNGKASGSTCGEGEASVGAGTYTIKLGTLGGEPGSTSFTLAAAPPPDTAPDPEAAGVG